jgi:hypothetical protein
MDARDAERPDGIASPRAITQIAWKKFNWFRKKIVTLQRHLLRLRPPIIVAYSMAVRVGWWRFRIVAKRGNSRFWMDWTHPDGYK